MGILNPKDDAAALQPLIDQAVQQAMNDLAEKVAPALGVAIQDALNGLTITITVSKK